MLNEKTGSHLVGPYGTSYNSALWNAIPPTVILEGPIGGLIEVALECEAKGSH